jgi:hypothetical protein
MEAHLRQLLTELEEAGRQHDAQEPDHARKLLNLEPASAHLLSILVRSSRRTWLLEIGTSNGYSTIWLTWATRPFGGHVISIDREADKLAASGSATHQSACKYFSKLLPRHPCRSRAQNAGKTTSSEESSSVLRAVRAPLPAFSLLGQ